MKRKALKKQQYYIEHFNPTHEIKIHDYLMLNMPWKEKYTLSRLQITNYGRNLRRNGTSELA